MKPTLKRYRFINLKTKQVANVITTRENFLVDGWPLGFNLFSITKL